MKFIDKLKLIAAENLNAESRWSPLTTIIPTKDLEAFIIFGSRAIHSAFSIEIRIKWLKIRRKIPTLPAVHLQRARLFHPIPPPLQAERYWWVKIKSCVLVEFASTFPARFVFYICTAPLQLRRDLVLKSASAGGFMCTEGRGREESDCESCIHMFSVLIYAIFCLFDLHLCCFELKLSPSPLPAPASLSSNELENFYMFSSGWRKLSGGFIFFG